jgi:hypothetical protein
VKSQRSWEVHTETSSKVSEISGSHGDEYEDDNFWGAAPCSLVEVD